MSSTRSVEDSGLIPLNSLRASTKPSSRICTIHSLGTPLSALTATAGCKTVVTAIWGLDSGV